MKTLYLDQNKWVDLARADTDPQSFSTNVDALATIRRLVADSELIVPLSAGNIYETQKINRLEQRVAVARIQSELSRGIVFNCGAFRCRVEIRKYLSDSYDIVGPTEAKRWFLSSCFLDAFATRENLTGDSKVAAEVIPLIERDPMGALFSYLIDIEDEGRKQAVRNYSEKSRELISSIDLRRNAMKAESARTHRKVYSASLALQHLDEINSVASAMGIDLWTFDQYKRQSLFQGISELPYFCVETELALKLERSHHSLTENDFRDMQGVSAALPYSDVLVLEKSFASLIVQTKLDKKFGTKIVTKIVDSIPSL